MNLNFKIKSVKYVIPFFAIFYTNCSNITTTSKSPSSYNSSQTCTQGGSVNAPAVNSRALTISGSDVNAVAVSVGCGYTNQPCVSVTICAPGSNGSTSCQTIPNLLLDTGSYGLRIFDSAKTTLGATISTAALTAVPNLYTCATYGDSSYQWGKVMLADVKLGSEVAASVPIQIVEASPTSETPNVPSGCSSGGYPDSASPGTYNGILGVGLETQDCGSYCTTYPNSNVYFSCTGNVCSGSTASLGNQITNPIALMPAGYNNGVALQLSNVGDAGAGSGGATGYMVLGIGTVANNTPPGGVQLYQANANLNFRTVFGGQIYTTSFIDSGSNGLFFPDGCVPIDGSGFFTPTSELGFTATQSSASGANPTIISFNSADQSQSSNLVFNNLTGDGGSMFDWGLPFFLGRTVYVGISGRSSGLGTGPYWAY